MDGVAHSPEFELDRIDLEIGFVLNDELQKEVVLPDGRKLVQRELSAERMGRPNLKRMHESIVEMQYSIVRSVCSRD